MFTQKFGLFICSLLWLSVFLYDLVFKYHYSPPTTTHIYFYGSFSHKQFAMPYLADIYSKVRLARVDRKALLPVWCHQNNVPVPLEACRAQLALN